MIISSILAPIISFVNNEEKKSKSCVDQKHIRKMASGIITTEEEYEMYRVILKSFARIDMVIAIMDIVPVTEKKGIN